MASKSCLTLSLIVSHHTIQITQSYYTSIFHLISSNTLAVACAIYANDSVSVCEDMQIQRHLRVYFHGYFVHQSSAPCCEEVRIC